MRRQSGFTLIELLVVLAIVALLLAIAAPRVVPRIDVTKETILADNLRVTRAVIDQFYADTGTCPESLAQLVEKKYLPNIPIDPVTNSRTTWIAVPATDGERRGICDIHSGAPGADRRGRAYADW